MDGDTPALLGPQTDRELAEMIARFRTPPGFGWIDLANDIETVLKGRRELGKAERDPRPDIDTPPEVIHAMARKPFTYLGRKGTHYLIRYPITVSWPVSLIDEWGPHPVDGPASAALIARPGNGGLGPWRPSEELLSPPAGEPEPG